MDKKEDIIEFTKSDNDVLEQGAVESDDGVLEKEIVEEAPIKPKKVSKNEEAKALIKNAEVLVHEADSEVNSVKEVVAKSVDRFEEAKATMLNTTMVHNMILLEKANFEHHKEESHEPFEVSLESMTDEFSLAKITSGRFTGLILAILGIMATALAWIFIASYKTGTEITPDQVPDEATQNTLLTWIGGGMTGAQGDPQFGLATLVVTALLIGWGIYKLRVSMRESRNFRVAHDTFEKSHGYVESQKAAKSEMERMDDHVNATTALIGDYKILLDEVNAKLQRVLHIEGSLESNRDYHSSSQQLMQDSEKLMNRMEDLLSTPMTKEGKLNEASEYALIEAKALYESYVSKLYNS